MTRLQDVCVLIVDSEHKTAPVGKQGHPMIRTPNIGRGYFLLEDVRRVDDPTYEQWTRRAVPQAGDLILAREAPVGNVAMVPAGLRPILGQRTVLIRPDRTQVEPRFLQYLMLGREIQSAMAARSSGATVAHLNMRDIRNLELPELPSLGDQRKIAALLGAYDELIENNQRQIAILEEMPRVVYREWFVYGPSLQNSGASDQQELPAGWTRTSLVNAAEIVMGQSPKSADVNERPEGLPFHQGVGTFGIRYPRGIRYTTVTNRVAEKDDVLFSVRAPVGRINVARERLVVGRGLAAIRSKRSRPWFLLYQLKEQFKEEDSIGGGTIFNAVTRRDMESIPFLVPPDDLEARFESFVDPMMRLIEILDQLTRNVSATRNLLLPRLISGDINVADLDIDTSWLAA